MLVYSKYYILIELRFLKELMLIKQVHEVSVIFVIIGISYLNYSFKFQPNVCNRCHDLLMISINFSNIAIWIIKSSNYHCIISLISKNEVINLMQNAELTDKKRIIVKHKSLLLHLKMSKEILIFGNIEIQKNNFTKISLLFF